MLPSGKPEDYGYKTLGWELLAWSGEWLAQPDGMNKGDTWSYTKDQAMFVLWFYALDEFGRWIFRRAYRERAKGVGKTPMVAAMACTELLGPVVFDGWDAYGEPVGRPHPNPLVQLAAVSESQADQTMVLINSMLANGEAEREWQLDIAMSRIYVPGGGKLEKVTASPRSREGARPSFVVLEETHNWVPAERGPEFAEVLRRNLAKVGGRSVEVTNAPLPGEESVAEKTHREFQRLTEGGITGGVLFDTESIHVEDVRDPEETTPALKWIYRNSPWVDVRDILVELSDSANRESHLRKYYFNEIVIGESGWLMPKEVDACISPKVKPLKKSDRIVLGFKGDIKHSAAVVAIRLKDMTIHVLKTWERPENAGREWEVDAVEVDNFVRKTMEKRDVWTGVADPWNYQDMVGRWAKDYGDGDVWEAFWLTSKAKYAKSIEQMETAIKKQRVKWHPDQAVLRRHILSCHIMETPQGDLLRKETLDSKRQITCAIASVLALEAAMLAIKDGALDAEIDRQMYAW